jgi:hypothetical protein
LVFAEARGYVISWFSTATYSLDFKSSCPHGGNGGQFELEVRQVRELGYSQAEAIKVVEDSGAQLSKEFRVRVFQNAQVNGRQVPIYNYPDATADPNIETVTGKYAYGFDLGGKPESKFEDPETHESIDNQLWRAVGCNVLFNAVPPTQPYVESISWHAYIDSAPGWAMRVVGADLSKNGKVTVILDRLTQHLLRDAVGNILTNTTYILDPSPRSHNVLQGQIKDGLLTVQPKNIYLEGEHPFYVEIALRNAHMRMVVKPENVVGYWGGYLNWRTFAYNFTSEPANEADDIGIFHALKKLADSDPDRKTGQNRYISGTFRMEAVPAYLADESGTIVAAPAQRQDPEAATKVAENGSQ